MRVSVASVLGAVGLAVACSSSDSAGDGDGVTSLDSTKPASALSDGEGNQYCADVKSYFEAHANDVKKFACAAAGGLAGAFTSNGEEAAAHCRSGFDECMAKPPEVSQNDRSCAELVAKLKECPATVAALDRCIVDEVQALGSFDAAKVCAEVSTPGGAASPTGASAPIMRLPPSCTSLPEGCGFLFPRASH
jgi:hypothetical protein